jgi:hypothetical protein
MSNVTTSSNKEKLKIFETILSSPGMTEKCKIVLTISRQNILVLSRLIEAGCQAANSAFQDEIMAALSHECLEEFRIIHEEILNKGNLSDFYQRLKLL